MKYERTAGKSLWYYYDAGGSPVGMALGGPVRTFIYRKNLQGDVTGIYSGTTGELLVSYVYDAWGKPEITDEAQTEESAELIARNCLLYRGYFYDHETGLYYLRSRYYDPEVGRFINADDHVDTTGGVLNSNLFAYCGNDPINRIDPEGTEWWHWVAAAVVVVALVAASIVTCGGAAAAAGAAAAIATGTCTAVSAGATIVTGAAMGAGAALAVSTGVALSQSSSWDEFAQHGEAALVNTLVGGVAGTAVGYINSQTACFVAGTLIKTENGDKPIEEVEVGDLVTAWDEETQRFSLKRVVETYVWETDELVYLTVEDEEITTTPNHPFWVPRKGWTEAIELRAGDILLTVNGEYVIVEKVQHEILEAPVKVYNFQVEDHHTYCVSEHGVVVHNSCGGETSATKYGREQHKNWDYGEGVKKEFSIPGVGRADAVDKANRIIYELKPNNARAISRGMKQLSRYAEGLSKLKGGLWKTKLITYESLK